MSKIIANDGLQSLIGGLGDPSRDKSASVYYAPMLLTDDQIQNIYSTSWVTQKLIKIPAEDSLRKWRSWQTEEQGALDKLEREEKRLGVREKLLRAKILARLWGGAAVFIGTGEEASEPLNPDTVNAGGIQYLTVLSRREIIAGELEYDALSPYYNKPKYYDVVSSAEGTARIHPSRLIIFVGNEHIDPTTAQGVNHGWGDSVINAAYSSIKNADSSAANAASLLFEANVDVIGIPDLLDGLGDKGFEENIMKRFTLAAANKSINKMLMHDTSETYERKAASFAQIPEMLEKFLLIAAGAADIPLTRFLGKSAAGMSSTGEGDMKNYYDKIASIQSLEIEPALTIFDKCLVRSALGTYPDGLYYNWNPLEQMSEKQIAEIGKITAETADILVSSGLFDSEKINKATTNQLVKTGVFPGLDTIEREGDFDFEEPEAEEDQR